MPASGSLIPGLPAWLRRNAGRATSVVRTETAGNLPDRENVLLALLARIVQLLTGSALRKRAFVTETSLIIDLSAE